MLDRTATEWDVESAPHHRAAAGGSVPMEHHPERVRPASHRRPPDRRRLVSWVGLGVYLIAVAVGWTLDGLPMQRDWLFLWIIAGLFAVSLADLKRWARGVFVDWLPLFVILLAYDVLRAKVANGRVAHWQLQVSFDKWLFAGRNPTVGLQHHFWHPGHPQWWDWAMLVIYNSHFCVPLVVAAVLWKVRHDLFRQYSIALIALTFAGFLTFYLYPAEPPWLASLHGHLQPTTRVVGDLWGRAGLHAVQDLFIDGGRYDNQVAAVPSLHAAYPMLIALFFWRRCRWWRIALVGYVLAMAATLVYGAEHFVFDILLGWAYAVAVVLVLALVRRWQQRRRQADADLAAEARRLADEEAAGAALPPA